MTETARCAVCGAVHAHVVDGACTRPSCMREQLRRRSHALQQVMQVLGPTGVPPDVDYGDKWNIMGLSTEVEEALRACRSVGIEYKVRGKSRTQRTA